MPAPNWFDSSWDSLKKYYKGARDSYNAYQAWKKTFPGGSYWSPQTQQPMTDLRKARIMYDNDRNKEYQQLKYHDMYKIFRRIPSSVVERLQSKFGTGPIKMGMPFRKMIGGPKSYRRHSYTSFSKNSRPIKRPALNNIRQPSNFIWPYQTMGRRRRRRRGRYLRLR